MTQSRRFIRGSDVLYLGRVAFLILGLLFSGVLATRAGGEARVWVTDLAGNKVNALEAGKARALVFLFVSTECPISNSYAPEYRRLAAEFGSKGVEFRLIYPNADEDTASVRKHLKEYDLPFTAWRDPQHELVKAAQARVTPEAAVYLIGQGWVYRGRIDDRYADFGKARPEAVKHDLRDVLAKITQGESVTPGSTRAVGCYIPGAS